MEVLAAGERTSGTWYFYLFVANLYVLAGIALPMLRRAWSPALLCVAAFGGAEIVYLCACAVAWPASDFAPCA